jgi:fructokinase
MRIGIDLGGTKIEGLLLTSDGSEAKRVRVLTPQGDYDATVLAIADLVRQLEQGTESPASVGIGIPGTISPQTGLVKNANSVCLIGRPLDQDIAKAIGRDVRLANDANCFAVSEAHDGAAAGAHVVFGVILGTGVGGGIAIDGRALVGANAIGGEWGHNPLPWPQILDDDDERPGPACYCGQHGCIETFLSGPGLSTDHKAHGGGEISAKAIATLARDGDDACAATLNRFERRLARALATIVNVIDPDVIVLGGGLSNIERLYKTVPQLWDAWVFSDHITTRLMKNVHGDSSGVRGAARLWD